MMIVNSVGSGKTLGQVTEVVIIWDPLNVSEYQSAVNNQEGKPLNMHSVNLTSGSAVQIK